MLEHPRPPTERDEARGVADRPEQRGEQDDLVVAVPGAELDGARRRGDGLDPEDVADVTDAIADVGEQPAELASPAFRVT